MNDDHMNAFVSECRESITALNNALLALEDDPDDEEAIESVFRTAHTLKGNFGAMGFETASELAHVLEDLLDEIRAGELTVTPEIMDAAFDGVDHIETIVNEIEASGEPETNPAATIERLGAAMESGGDETETAEATEAGAGGDEDADGAGPSFAHADGVPAFDEADAVAHAVVDVDPDGMLGVDGMLVLEPVDDEFGAFETAPGRSAIEEGAYDGSFDLFVADAEPAALAEFLSDIGAVESHETAVVGGAPAETASDETTGGTDDGAATAATDGTDDGAAGDATDDADVAGTADDGADADATGPTDDGATADGDAADDAAPADATSDGTADEASSSGGASGGDSGSTGASSPSSSAGGSDISSVRVDVDRLDELHGLVEQLVTGRITIRRAIENGDLETAETNLNDFDKVTSRLQNTVMDMRLIPLRRVVSNLPRVVRDVARDEGKDVSFEMHGEDIELDRSILTEIEDPLIHILRNAVDHGIEPPEERAAAGKPREGNIELRASRQRDHVEIEVSDDGAGIDPDGIRQKAVSEGVITESEAESMPDDEAYDLVFHPGFSTANEVTDVSGRGVGMDVVHSTVEQLDGSVNVDSELGEGTTVSLRLPVSVAIVDILFVQVGAHEYGIPIKNIDELTHADAIETVNGDEVVRHGDEIYPVIRLGEALEIDETAIRAEAEAAMAADGAGPGDDGEAATGHAGDADGSGMLVRIRDSVRPVALRCDAFTDQEEVVVKPLEGALGGIPGLSGTAILGDGNIVPILDVVSLKS